MEFRVLGPLEVVHGGQRLRLGGVKQRAVLAILLLNANRVVSVDRLVDELWDGRPPGSAIGTLQTYVSHLRDLLEPQRDRRATAQVLVTRSPGYLLRVGADDLDAPRLERLVGQGQQALAAGDAPVAAARFRVALELWRGPALADFIGLPFATTEIDRLEQLRLVAIEGRVEAELAMGRHAELTGELEALVADHPLREGFRAQLMLALYRSGRQADALGVYRATRELLTSELGLDPDDRLTQLEQAVLRHAPELVWRADQERQGARPADTATINRRVHLPPVDFLVGREREMAELRGALAEVRTGQGRLVLVAGEPGIGKTRLARELSEEAQADGWQVLWGRVWEEDGAPSFWPWVQIARAWMADRTVEQLSSGFAADAAVIGQLVPELSQRLPGLPEPAGLEPALARFRLFDGITSWLDEPPPSSRSSWSWTTCIGPTRRRCCCCASSLASWARPTCWCWAPTVTRRPPTGRLPGHWPSSLASRWRGGSGSRVSILPRWHCLSSWPAAGRHRRRCCRASMNEPAATPSSCARSCTCCRSRVG